MSAGGILLVALAIAVGMVGIVVGIIDEQGTRIISHGTISRTDSTPVDGDTIFEIGSVSKVFTTELLADMVGKGEVKLDDPVGEIYEMKTRPNGIRVARMRAPIASLRPI